MINRRSFIKALTLVPFIDWNKPVRFELCAGSLNYKHYFYGGNAGGGKSEKLMNPLITPQWINYNIHRTINHATR